MDGVFKELQNVYDLVSTIPVSGDYAETMTAVRLQLRHIFRALQQIDKKEETVDG